ncbi:MAG: RNA methyltransferase [Bacteroidetes bacterium]|nr:RNA methyltransferase [Bacteroidota bacterium]
MSFAFFEDLKIDKTNDYLCLKKRELKTTSKEGYFGIGVFRGKTEHNIGTLWRSAYILGASYIFTVEGKYKKQSSDVVKAWSRIPLFNYDTFNELLKNIPHDCRLVGVEICDEATELADFEHPQRAIYLLGSEDFGLPTEVREKCHFLIKLKGNTSMNVGVTGSVVIYDRITKIPTSLPDYHRAE